MPRDRNINSADYNLKYVVYRYSEVEYATDAYGKLSKRW